MIAVCADISHACGVSMGAALKPLAMVALRMACDHEDAMVRAVMDRLRFGDAMSYREIAKAHNVSHRTLCDNYQRFRREFVRACKAENVDPTLVLESQPLPARTRRRVSRASNA